MQKKGEVKAYDLIIIIVAICLVGIAVYGVILQITNLFSPYPFDYSASVVANSHLSYLYKNFTSYPYLITYYPPLYYILIAGMKTLYTTSSPYTNIRLLNLIASFFDAVMMYLIGVKLTQKRKIMGVLAPIFYFSSFFFLTYESRSGPLLLELLFDLIGIFFLMNYKNRRAIVYSAAAFSVGFFFKQTALIVFVAALIYLLSTKKRKDALIFAGVFILISLPPILILNALTDGRYVLSLFILPLITPIDPTEILNWGWFFVYLSPVIPLGIFVLYWLRYNWKSLLAFALVISTVVTVVSVGKVGATTVYYVVPLAFFSLAAMDGIELMIEKKKGNMIYFVLGYMFFTFLLMDVIGYYIFAYPHNIDDYNAGLLLKNVSGNILCENPTVTVAANKSIMFEESVFWALINKGYFNDSQIVTSIKEHQFAVICNPGPIATAGRFDRYPDIVNAVNSSYHVSEIAYNWTIYVPN